MVYSDTGLTQKVDILKTAINKAEAIIIGVGSGLSSAAGLDYSDIDFFNIVVLLYKTEDICYTITHGIRRDI